ncbi:MAG: replication-relaxation family protein [Pseudomonadota bacterium]
MEYTQKHLSKLNQPLPRLTERAIKWLTFLNRHGPLPSHYLYEYTRATHRCKDTCLRNLKTLCEQGILYRPPQQMNFPNAPFNPYIYDLSDRGHAALIEAGIEKNPTRPTGHFPHLHMTACVTASIEMEAIKAGNEYIEAKTILALKDSALAIPLKSGKLIPDQLFAIKTTLGYRAYALEVDRGTEPIASPAMRKSYQRSIEQYKEVFEQELSKTHYGLTAPLICIWLFSKKTRLRAFEVLMKEIKLQNKIILETYENYVLNVHRIIR